MSDTHEPSYYEIALTNRQVVVAFVILLACLLTAFFSGVWVGRGGAEPAVEGAVRATPPQAEQREAAALEEALDFFEDDAAAPAPASAQDTAAARKPSAAGTTSPPAPPPAEQAFEDQAVQAAPDSAATTEAQREARRRRRAEREAQKAAAGAAPAADVVTPRRVPEVAPAPSPPPSSPAAEPATGSVVIQVFASPDSAEAQRIRDRLKVGGQRAYLSPVEVGGRTLYRVRIGPFRSKDEAEEVAERVRKSYRLDTWVTQ